MTNTLSEELVLDFDGWLGRQTPEMRQGIDAHLRASGPVAAREKKRLASMFAVAEETGLDLGTVNDRWDTIRGGYAEQQGGDWLAVKDDEEAFNGRLVQHVTKKRDFRIQSESFAESGARAALRLNPGDLLADLASMRESAGTIDSFGPEESSKFLGAYRAAREEQEAKAGPLRPVAREIFDGLSKGKLERFGEESQAAIDAAIDKLAELPEDQRGLVLAMLQAEGGADTSANTTEKTAGAAIRGLTGQLRGIASNTRRQGILRRKEMLEADPEIYISEDQSLEETYRQMSGQEAAGLQNPLSSRLATAEEKAVLLAMAEKELTRNEVAAQAVGILEGSIDPIRTQGMGQKLAVNVGSSMGAMVPAFIPYAGLVIQQGAFADQEYQRQRSMGTDPATANTVAQVTGTVQSGLDRLQAVAAIALPMKIPVGRLATSGLAGSTAARMTTGIAGTQAAEYGIEVAQNAVPTLTAALAGPLGWSLPEQAQYEQEISKWKVWDPEMFMTLLPLSLLGGGYQGVQSAAVARDYLGDVVGMQAVGIAPAEATRIAAMPEAERVAAYQAAYEKRDPASPAAASAQQEVSTRTAEAIERGRQEVEAQEAAGLRISRAGDGWNVVDSASGTTYLSATAEEAMTTARAVMKERGIVKEETFIDALGTFAARLQEGRTLEVSEESGNLFEELERATADDRQADVATIWDRADQYRRSVGLDVLERDRLNPDSRNALAELAVFGKSITEAREGAARSVSLILQGGGTLDLVEEQAENDLREAVSAGKVSMSTMRGIIKRIETATGDKYLFVDSENGVTEAWSSLVRLYSTGTRKGNKVTAGARKETAADLRRERRSLREAEAAGVTPSAFTKMREYYDQLRATMGQVARLMKAQKAGKLGDIEAMIRESVGLTEQDSHDNAVADVVEEYIPPSPEQEASGQAFSVGPAARLRAVQARVDARLATDPEARRKVAAEAARRLRKLETDWTTERQTWKGDAIKPIADPRSKKSLDKEQAFREADFYTEFEAEAFDSLTPAAQQALGMTGEDVSAFGGPLAQRFTGGRFGTRGRLKGRAVALKESDSGVVRLKGEYDGAAGLPPMFFGGAILPDQAAQEAYEAGEIKEPTPDALWDALRSELQTQANNKDAMKAAMASLKEAQKQARNKAQEASIEWRKQQDAKQAKDYSPRAALLRDMRTLDAVVMALPEELRAKVGGMIKLAGLATDRARAEEIMRRIDSIAPLLERHLQKEYTAAMEALLERAKPVKGAPGEKMTGRLGADVQGLMNAVEAAMKMTPAQVDGRLASLDTQLADPDLTPEAEALLQRERELISLTGAWYPKSELTGKVDKNGKPLAKRVYDGLDAAQMDAALTAVTETFEGGYLEWARKQLAKRERRAAKRDALRGDTGKAGTKVQRDARAEQDMGWIGKTKDFFLSLSSFDEVVRYVFGDSTTARRMVDEERAASNAYEDARNAMAERVMNHFAQMAGGHLAGEKLRFRMSQKSITAADGVKLSEMEAIQALLLWQQPDGQRHMIGALDENGQPAGPWHYGQAWVDSVASQMTPEGKSTMAFIQQVYGAEWAGLNPLYRERHGVNLPRHANYAPITVKPQQAKAGEMVDPVTGQATTGSILTPGSLRTRSRNAIAEPEFRDALQTMLAHHAQMEHWKAYYDFAVEAQAVLGNRELGNAVNAAAGKQGETVLRKWIELFAQGGTRDAGAALAANRALTEISGRAARMALVGRAGTLMIQSTQLGAALAEMPTGAYLGRMGKLMTGNLGWGDAVRSEYIQRRIAQMPPIVRQAMAGLDSTNPNAVKHAVARLGTLISGADGLFTAGTYAILLDYHRGQAARQGFTGPEAEAYAHAEAERSTERVAQPTRLGTRSLFENTTTNPLGKLSWAFASEARQKIALAAWAARDVKKNPARAARVAMVVWGAGGLMAAGIRNAWRDMRDDDDDEIFDERNWSLPQLIAATLSGPLQGIPGLGEALQSAVAATFKTYNPEGNLFSGLGRSVPAAMDLVTADFLDSEEPVEDIMKDVEAVLMAAGLMNETVAAAASLMHVVRDGVSVLDGLRDDATEKGKKQLAKERKAAEALEPVPTPEQEKAAKAAKKAEKEAKLKAAAGRAEK